MRRSCGRCARGEFRLAIEATDAIAPAFGNWGTSAVRSSCNGREPALDQASTTANARPFVVTNRSVLAIAVPMTLAYLTTPMLGIVDTAVVGQFGDAALLGGLAAGAIDLRRRLHRLQFPALRNHRPRRPGFRARRHAGGTGGVLARRR